MKLFIDDERRAPSGWNIARSLDMAYIFLVDALEKGERPEAVSFDHDLGGDDTTRPIVLWMCENEFWPIEAYVHSGNLVGEEWLVGMIRRYAPPGTLRGYGLNFWGTGPDSRIQNWVTS